MTFYERSKYSDVDKIKNSITKRCVVTFRRMRTFNFSLYKTIVTAARYTRFGDCSLLTANAQTAVVKISHGKRDYSIIFLFYVNNDYFLR